MIDQIKMAIAIVIMFIIFVVSGNDWYADTNVVWGKVADGFIELDDERGEIR